MSGLNLKPVKNKNLKVTRALLNVLSKLFYGDIYLGIEFPDGKPTITKRKWTGKTWITL